MQIIIAAIGKLKKNAPEAVLIDDYIKKSRLPIVVKELEEKKSLSGEALKTAESKLLCQAIPPGAKIVVLDEGGQTPASRAKTIWDNHPYHRD